MRTRNAFTLIELVVVITILGVLAAVIIPRLFGRVGESKQAVARQKIAVLEQQVNLFQTDNERYPTAQEGLKALIRAPADVSDNWRPYVKDKDILDPWGIEFYYQFPGRQSFDFDIFTYGSDGQEGGEGEAADIGNWQ